MPVTNVFAAPAWYKWNVITAIHFHGVIVILKCGMVTAGHLVGLWYLK